MTTIELRCPERTYRLFGKLTVDKPTIVKGNLIEFSCRDCRREQGVAQVLHHYNMAGECVRTLIEEE